VRIICLDVPYDPVTGGAYIRTGRRTVIGERRVRESVPVADDGPASSITIHIDESSQQLSGIEVMNASQTLPAEFLTLLRR